MPRPVRVVLVVVLGVAAALLVATPLGGNLWGILTGAGFHVPAESTVLTFRATVMNEGSGEWWLYGEDGRNYYGVPESAAPPSGYLVFPKRLAGRCPGFAPHDTSTWCPEFAAGGRSGDAETRR